MNLSRTAWRNCFLVCFILLIPVVASAEELLRGPYLQMGTQEGVTIRWRSDQPTDSKVEYGDGPANLTHSVIIAESVIDHVVTLTGLDAGTTYFYNVGSTTGPPLAGGDSKHFFKTHPGAVCGNGTCEAADGEDCVSCPDDCNGKQSGNPFSRFCCGSGGGENPVSCSDSRCTDGASCTDVPATSGHSVRMWVLGDPGWNQTQVGGGGGGGGSEKMYQGFQVANGGAFIDVWLMLGDNAYNDGTDEEFQESVFDVFTEHLPNTILWSTRGNHERTDFSGSVYYDIHTFPTNGEAGGVASGTEEYYSFDFANIHFINLDSQGGTMAPDSRQAEWLSADITDTTQDWIVAMWHHPPYTKGSHDSDEEGQHVASREYMVPILEAGGVDLVLCGHSHGYERSFLIDGHYGSSDTFDPSAHLLDGGSGSGSTPYEKDQGPHNGAVYVVEGGSSFVYSDTKYGHPVHLVEVNKIGSLIIETSGNTLSVTRIRKFGTIGDTFSIVKTLAGPNPKAHTPKPFDRGDEVEPSPGAFGVNVDQVLMWAAGDGAISHDVYFGTNPTPGIGEFQGNQGGTSFDVGTLARQTDYYWRIDEINAGGTVTGDVWTFTTEGPDAYIEMSKLSYGEAENVVVSYFNVPKFNYNWVGLYDAGPGTDPDDHGAYVSFRYIDPDDGPDGSVSWSPRSAGIYEARLFYYDVYGLVARADVFTVVVCNENGVCESGEDCETCGDCAGNGTGKPSTRFCCGNGELEGAEGDGAICDGNP
jgi:hypothetical protein